MRVLVTGGAGYIGGHVLRMLLEQGGTAWAFDDLSTGHESAVRKGHLRVGCTSDREAVARVLRDERIEAVVHCAGSIQVGESVKDPFSYWTNNVTSSLTLLSEMANAGVRRFVFSSSAAVYGAAEVSPIPESAPTRPSSPYGTTKLVLELALRDWMQSHGLGWVALRYFNAAGAHPDGTLGEDHRCETHLIPLILQHALGRAPALHVFGTDYPTPDGTCIRDYVHVQDLARAHLLALAAATPGQGFAANLGTGRGHSVREVIAACEAVVGRALPVRTAARRPGDPASLIADPTLARTALGWTATESDLPGIVASAWRWHEAHPAGFASR